MLFPSPFCLVYVGWFYIVLRIVLDLLKNLEECVHTDWSRFLRQIILSLPLGWTHAQQVSRKICVIKGQYFIGGQICLWAVEQARQHLKVAVQLFHSDKKLMY